MNRRIYYPSRCSGEHLPIAAVGSHTQALLRGRLVRWDGAKGKGELKDQTGAIKLSYDGDETFCIGDILELSGKKAEEGYFQVLEVRCLTPCTRDYNGEDWLRFHGEKQSLLRRLEIRSRILYTLRQFFSQRGFIEVETPHLLKHASCEVHIEQFETIYRTPEGAVPLYLATSPELNLKRLLGVGLERIYQLGRCFRNGERSAQHNPEFTMMEWYQAYASYEDIMNETEELVAHVWSEVVGTQSPLWRTVVEERPWRRLSVQDAFEQCVGVDIGKHCDKKGLYKALQRVGFSSADETDTWEDLFNKVLIEKIEPHLALGGPSFLYDYPNQLGAMSRQKESDGRWMERVELYLSGIELANGYTELNDPVEQRKRFIQARSLQWDAPIDEDFIESMERAIPPAGGMALGVDRLVMLATEANSIDEVLPFPLT